MSETTLTLVLGGDVPLDKVAEGIQHFRWLIDTLTQEVSGTGSFPIRRALRMQLGD